MTLLVDASGWVIAGLTAVTVVLPFVLRRRLRWVGSYLERLQPHYWIGFTIAGLSLVHAGMAMSSGPIPSSVSWSVGIWIATGGMLLVFPQVSMGVGLRKPGGADRKRRRLLHLGTMLVLVLAGAGHLALNSPLVSGLLRFS